jgi:hypothetical protein
MIDNVLYFPSIRVPETEWFTRVLLYWDTVGTIVPTEYQDDPQFLRPYTAELIEKGLLKVVTPDSTIWELGAGKYYDAFFALIEKLPLERAKLPFPGRETVRIHVDKTGAGLASELQNRSLAIHIAGQNDGDRWYEVEKQIGNLLMAYLATILGQNPKQRMVPITDSADCLKAFARVPFGERVVAGRLDPIRTEILADLLPAPVDPVPPAQLVKFKDRYRKLLSSFRAAIEQRVVEVASTEPELRDYRIGLIKSQLKGQLEEIVRRMKEHGWLRIGWGALLAVVAAGFLIADTATTGGMLTMLGASFGLSAAVVGAFEGSWSPKEFFANPMAYAALAHGLCSA